MQVMQPCINMQTFLSVIHIIIPLFLSAHPRLDRQKYFAYPISAEEVKDYHDVIKDPICFQIINEKLGAHIYQTVEGFAVSFCLLGPGPWYCEPYEGPYLISIYLT